MACLCAVISLAIASPAGAHPLGNDSITHFNVLYILPDRLEVDFLLDLAENPTQFIESSEIDANKDGQASREEQEAWLETKVFEYAAFLNARIDGIDLKLSLVPEQVDPASGQKLTTSKVIVPMLGPMGMTYRLVIRYAARFPQPLGPGEHVIEYEDKTYPQHVGLKLVLLEPTPPLCRIYDVEMASLQAGLVRDAMKTAFADEALPLARPDTARIEPAPPSPTGQTRWRLIDGDRQIGLLAADDGIDAYNLPLCDILEPHPPFVSEDNAVFRYEQYDPVNLPDVRKGTVRFVVFDRAARAASAPMTVAEAEMESVSGPTSRPADDRMLPSYATTFLDPAYNPIQTSEYQRQAGKMIAMLQGEWGLILFLLVTGTAFAWGAAHALMPGHAKTVVAAYLISQHGTYWHAAILAVIVTVTHTALVVIMGLVIWAYQQTNPRLAPKIQLWLGLVAGLLVLSMGLTLLWRAVSGRIAGHDHDHDHAHTDGRPWWRKLFTHSHPHLPDDEGGHGHVHAHDHGHHHEHVHAHVHAHDHSHGHAHDHAHPHVHTHDHDHGHRPSHAPVRPRRSADQLTLRMLLVLGITGGIVPCPSATIIMFLGIGANVVGGALYAIAVFSLGLALTLMLIGSLALASRRFAAKVMSDARHEHELSGPGRRLLLQVVPALSGLVVMALGGMIAFHYLCLMRNVASPFPWMG